MKTKREFAAKAAELYAIVATLETDLETYRKAWRASGYDDHDAYVSYNKTERSLKQAKKDAEFYSMIASGVALYANQFFYSDVEPWEVLEIKTDRCIVVREMKAEITAEGRKKLQESFVPGGFIGHFDNDAQEWKITPDPDGCVATIRRHKDGGFYLPGSRGTFFKLSTKPFKKYDYNF